MRGSAVIIREYTASEIKEFACKLLLARGSFVYPINNAPVRRRKGTTKRGFPDLAGHNRAGVAVYCEVKTVRDKFSEEQIEFMTGAEKCGCLCFVATQFLGSMRVDVLPVMEYFNLKNIKPKV